MRTGGEYGNAVLRKTERQLHRLSSEQTPDSVHRFRTTSRRLEILLEHLVGTPDRNQRKLLKLLSRIRRRAGRVRDIDVQLSALRSLKIHLEPRRKTQLAQRLIGLRVRQEERLRKLLKKDDIREIRRRLKKASNGFEVQTVRDPLQMAKQLITSATRPADHLDDEALHHYRLAVKQARYAAEFAPASAEATRLIAELKHLQDALGSWHDWMTLTQTAAHYLGEVNQSPLVAALHNLSRGKFRHAVAELTKSTLVRAGKSASSQLGIPTTSAKRPSTAARAETAA